MTEREGGSAADPPVRSIEDLAGELALDVRHLPVDAIEPMPGNPNVLTDDIREALSGEIDRGFLQPIVVRETDEPERFQLVDGEHRWELVREKGYRTIPSVVTGMDEDEARIRLLTMNRLRGQFVPIKLAYFVADLAKRVPEDELRRRLGMDGAEMRDHLALADFTDPVGDRVRAARDAEERVAPVVLSFPVRRQDAAVIERVVTSLTGDRMDRGKALTRICRDYEKWAKERA